jgi:CTP synthase (UTP-ammonia lyase)
LLGVDLDIEWIPTGDLETGAPDRLGGLDGLWSPPGSPYRSLTGALAAIRFARESGLPFIGTCGGYQHAILEYARNVMGFADAQHAEYDSTSSRLFISALACSLAGQTMRVFLQPGTTAHALYGVGEADEAYYCNFGLNPDERPALEASGLVVSGIDRDGEARIVELPGHPFFLATLFVPQTASTLERPHPLVTGFVAAARDHALARQTSRSAVHP